MRLRWGVGEGRKAERKTLEKWRDEESMPGGTTTTHCIFLRERECGGSINMNQKEGARALL